VKGMWKAVEILLENLIVEIKTNQRKNPHHGQG
jgi:hypothetical protein